MKAQDFGEGPVNANAHVLAWDLVPIKESNREELIKKFGGDAQVRFSVSEEQAQEIHEADVPLETWLIQHRMNLIADLLKEEE